MHMHITYPNPGGGLAMIEVDGVDISKHVRARDFKIALENMVTDGDPEVLRPVVHLALRPDTIVVDGEIADYEEFALALDRAGVLA